jgi:hypothetical protein
MGHDVMDIGSWHDEAACFAALADGMLGELPAPEMLPSLGMVEAMVGLGFG